MPPDCRGATVAIGNFDGVHLGHRAVFAKAQGLAAAKGAPFGVLTFEPHPRTFFGRANGNFRLTPFRPKARLLEGCGVDVLFVRRFDAGLAAVEAEAFASTILGDELGVGGVVVGEDFRFGKERAGDVEMLRRVGAAKGYAVEVVGPVADAAGVDYASSTIRGYLREGQPEAAAGPLGRWWEIEGHVQHGDKRGRTIGFPTANLRLRNYLMPATGVYAVRAAESRSRDGGWRDGVANLGTRPTVDGTRTLLEVHLLDFDGDLYGRGLRVALLAHLRPEQKFNGLAELKAQIGADVEQARALLAATPAPA